LSGGQDLIEKKDRKSAVIVKRTRSQLWQDMDRQSYNIEKEYCLWAGFDADLVQGMLLPSSKQEVNSTLHTWDWHSCPGSTFLHACPFFGKI